MLWLEFISKDKHENNLKCNYKHSANIWKTFEINFIKYSKKNMKYLKFFVNIFNINEKYLKCNWHLKNKEIVIQLVNTFENDILKN